VGSQAALCDEMQNWSSAASWGGAGVPVANANVTLPAGASIKVDVNTPHLNRVTIPAGTTLCFPDRATTFSAKQIITLGTFQAGSPTNRLASDVTIKLEGGTATDPDNYTVTGQAATAIDQYNAAYGGRCAPMPMGCIGVGKNIGTNLLTAHNGGTISVYGRDSGTTWSDLASTAVAGATSITVRDAVTWRAGDVIVVASTDFNWENQERKIVSSVTNGGKTINLTTPLARKHSGISTCETLNAETRCIDERAEVGLLSHNIKIAGPDDAAANGGFGGQVITLSGATVGMDGVEMYNLGQKGKMARYPLHFHIMGDTGSNVRVSNLGMHDSFNRFVDFHGTNYAQLTGIVADDTIGHGIMFEDGTEHNNVVTRNMVGAIRFNPVTSERLRLSDEAPTSFWITNVNNDFVGNHAYGADGNGFWIDYIDDASYWDIAWEKWAGLFNDNVAHSNRDKSGLRNLAPHEQGNGFFVGNYIGDPNSATEVYRNAAWKNTDMGFWIDGAVTFVDSMSANQYVGVTMQGSYMKGGIFRYTTDNTEIGAIDDAHGGGLLRAYHGAADFEDIWLAGYGGTASTKLMSAITDGAAGITEQPPRVKNLKFFGTGYKTLFEACPFTSGGTTKWGACYYGLTHAGNSHVVYDMDGSLMGNGVSAAITNSQPFLRYGSTWLHTSVPGGPYGTVNRGWVIPFENKFGLFNTSPGSGSGNSGPGPSGAGVMRRDSDGIEADISSWMLVRKGDRYFLDAPSFKSGLQIFGDYSGYVQVYQNAPSQPTKVMRCIYNTDCGGVEGKDRYTQPKASSLANLGIDGTWWYGGGKVYIHAASTGDVHFGLANSDHVEGDKWGQGAWWSIRL
ncbi:MAG: G8 domain-containing protein, partial [Candidatus Saccharimonadales bacterium]